MFGSLARRIGANARGLRARLRHVAAGLPFTLCCALKGRRVVVLAGRSLFVELYGVLFVCHCTLEMFLRRPYALGRMVLGLVAALAIGAHGAGRYS